GFTYARSRVEKPRAKRHAGGLAHALAPSIRFEPMTPDAFSSAWLSALATIIVIDLVLAGDNAIVIGLAARNVPKEMQKRVVLWGTAGAIIVRALLTFVVVWLLKIPLFLLIGGLALIYIGWRITKDD